MAQGVATHAVLQLRKDNRVRSRATRDSSGASVGSDLENSDPEEVSLEIPRAKTLAGWKKIGR